MSRNAIRGPTSALTDFLKTSGITPTTIARRVATREQPTAGPSGTQGNNGEQAQEQSGAGAAEPSTRGRTRSRAAIAAGYASDELDEQEGVQPETTATSTKKRKLTKAAEAKAKAKGGGNGRRDGGGGGDSEDDAYNALSKSLWTNGSPKPPVGNFENCARCEKQFTVTKYTLAANPGPGFLCHQCAKASGSDPFKKPAIPKRRKAPADKRTIVNFEERKFPSLVMICTELITKHIDDVEALGDIGTVNMEAISKALSKSRGLTPQNAHLFYNTSNTTLTLYDATNLPSPALTTLAYLNPNLTSLRLDFCGHLDNPAMQTLSASLPYLTHLELLGPFLVRTDTWKAFFTSHPRLEAFLITQSPRFDLGCMQALADNCGASLKLLRLKEIGKMEDGFLEEIRKVGEMGTGRLTCLDISDPTTSCSEEAVIELLEAIGGTLTELNLTRHDLLTDAFLEKGLKPHTRVLETLTLAHLPELTDKGVAEFFRTWTAPPLRSLDMSRNHELGSDALMGLLEHSGTKLEELGLNGWKSVEEQALKDVGRLGVELRKVDVGWCREMDDFVVKAWLEGDGPAVAGCGRLTEIKLWGCNKITERCPRKRGVSLHGIESQAVLR